MLKPMGFALGNGFGRCSECIRKRGIIDGFALVARRLRSEGQIAERDSLEMPQFPVL